MLLEEAVLYLLQRAGYKPVDSAGADETLVDGAAGLNVKGRGTLHQADAVADYLVAQPFTHPQRLIVEAKCHPGGTVDLGVVRNTVGVMKDINEYWVPSPRAISGRQRFHYQAAIVSATGFSLPAQRYAFAQDVYLVPFGESAFMRPVVEAIQDFAAPGVRTIDLRLFQLRSLIRERLRAGRTGMPLFTDEENEASYERFLAACRRIGFSLIGLVSRRFPLFLVPADGVRPEDLPARTFVRITRDERSWYLRDGRRVLFSFDLPSELFELYAEEGALSRDAALNLKEELLSAIQAFHIAPDNTVRLLTFELEGGWIDRMRNREVRE